MRKASYAFLPLLFALPSKAEGLEVSLMGVVASFKEEKPYPSMSYLGIGVRAARFVEGVGNHDHAFLSITPPRTTDAMDPVTYGFVGAGYAMEAASVTCGWFASLGSELRVERIHAAAFKGVPTAETRTSVRPWVLCSVGWKGLLIPLPGLDIFNYYATRSRRVYPFTRLELSYPLIRADGNGFSGMLSRTTNAPQIAIHMGVHF